MNMPSIVPAKPEPNAKVPLSDPRGPPYGEDRHPLTAAHCNFTNCGTRTTRSAVVHGLSKKSQKIKQYKTSFNKCSYIENLIQLFVI
jgi:hypothetical protein